MAFLSVEGVRMVGVSAAVPSLVEENSSLQSFLSREEYERFVASTGVERRHVSQRLLSSDLCVAAANKLIDDLGWSRESVDGLSS